MTDEPLDPLDPALATLLASDRVVDAPREALGRVWSRVAMAPLVVSPVAPPTPSAHGWLASHAAGVAVAAFVVGGAVGAALHAKLERPAAPQIVYVDRPAPPRASAPAPVVSSEVPPPPLPSAVAPLHATHPAPSASGSLSAERALVEQARAELGAGDATHALVLLDEHARRFAKPQLAEEREALAVQALVTLGRYDEARARGAKFKAATPGSLFLPAIEASLGSIP